MSVFIIAEFAEGMEIFVKQRGKKLIFTILLAALVAAEGTGCSMGGASRSMAGEIQASTESAVLTVQMENPSYKSIYVTTEMIGTVQPEKTAAVYPKASGTITAVYFEVGDAVGEGQVLATLDTDNLNAAQISINSAQLQLETAEKELERAQVLYENDGITLQSLETAEHTVRSAQLQLESAQDTYSTLLKNSSIVSPMSGVIESKDVNVYDNASMQQAICVISQKSNMEVVFQVSERVKNSLKLGNAVTVEKNNTAYQAVITEIAGKTSDDTGLFEIKARINNGETLSTGSKVTVSLVTDRAENVLSVPLDAVYYDDGKPYVFISKDGIAEIVYVETGIYDNGVMQIVSGLTESSRVITSWSSQLTGGALVQSVEDMEKKRNAVDEPSPDATDREAQEAQAEVKAGEQA